MRKQLLDEATIALAAIDHVNIQGFAFDQNASRNAMLVALLIAILEVRYQWLEASEARLAQLKRQRSAKSILAGAKQTYQDSAVVLTALIRKLGG